MHNLTPRRIYQPSRPPPLFTSVLYSATYVPSIPRSLYIGVHQRCIATRRTYIGGLSIPRGNSRAIRRNGAVAEDGGQDENGGEEYRAKRETNRARERNGARCSPTCNLPREVYRVLNISRPNRLLFSSSRTITNIAKISVNPRIFDGA